MRILDSMRSWFANLPDGVQQTILLIGLSIFVVLMSFAVYVVFFRSEVSKPQPVIPVEQLLPRLPDDAGEGSKRTPVAVDQYTGEFPLDETVIPERLDAPSEIADGGKTRTTDFVENKTSGVSSIENALLYYNQDDAKFYEVRPDGVSVALLDRTFIGVSEVTWRPGEKQSIIEFVDGSNIYYDFETKRQVTLLKDAQDFEFTQDGGRLAYEIAGPNESDNWLYVANPDGTAARPITPIGNKFNDVQVAWSPGGDVVAMFRESSGLDSQEVIFIGQNQENYLSLQTNGRGFLGRWSPTGGDLVYSVHNEATDYTPRLWAANGDTDRLGQNNRELGLSTWADKCAFTANGDGMYCGVPRFVRPSSGIFREAAVDVPDDIYYVDLRTGLKTVVAQPVHDYGGGFFTVEPESMVLSDDGRYLYFIDTATGQLERMQIKQ